MRRWFFLVSVVFCLIPACNNENAAGRFSGNATGTFSGVFGSSGLVTKNITQDMTLQVAKVQAQEYRLVFGTCTVQASGRETDLRGMQLQGHGPTCELNVAGERLTLTDVAGTLTYQDPDSVTFSFSASGPSSADGSLPQLSLTLQGQRQEQ